MKSIWALIFVLVVVLLISCSEKSGKNSTLGGDGTTGTGGFGGLSSDALDDIPTDGLSEDQKDALNSAIGGVKDVEGLGENLQDSLENGSPSAVGDLAKFLSALRNYRKIADLLNAAGFSSLARAFYRASFLRPVFVYYNPTVKTGRHFYTEDAAEGLSAEKNGYGFKTVAFNVYSTQFEDCGTSLNRCLWEESPDYFLVTTTECGTGQNAQKRLGYICPTSRAEAPLGLTEVINIGATSSTSHHFSTIDPAELAKVLAQGNQVVAVLGYTPL